MVFVSRFKKLLFIVAITLLISACGHRDPVPASIPDNSKMTDSIAAGMLGGATIGALSTGVGIPITAAMGGIIGGVVGQIITESDALLADLNREHLQIMRVGEDLMIVLPTDSYFYPNSSRLNEHFYSGLNHVADFIKLFETEVIKIAGYTDATGNNMRNLALSRQQAQNISHYLWDQGLDARMMYATGYGSAFPIANNYEHGGRAANRRVQISFRIIPKDSA